jgi:folate-dependent phosphoribosylglycinamide formyltransferase PurN
LSGGPLRLGWFSTGRGEGSYGLLKAALDAITAGELNARIEFVFCNREKGQAEGSDRFIAFVQENRIPLVTLSSQRFRKEHGNARWADLREEFDNAALKLLAKFDVDLTVNAGYMLIAPVLCRKYPMINLHPALPGGPIGMWQDVIWELIEKEATESGAMVHIVTEEVDGGPVLSYCRFSARGPGMDRLWREASNRPAADLRKEHGEEFPLFKRLREMGLVRERPLVVETLKAIAKGQIKLEKAAARGPVDLTGAVEAKLAAAARIDR